MELGPPESMLGSFQRGLHLHCWPRKFLAAFNQGGHPRPTQPASSSTGALAQGEAVAPLTTLPGQLQRPSGCPDRLQLLPARLAQVLHQAPPPLPWQSPGPLLHSAPGSLPSALSQATSLAVTFRAPLFPGRRTKRPLLLPHPERHLSASDKACQGPLPPGTRQVRGHSAWRSLLQLCSDLRGGREELGGGVATPRDDG